MTGRILILTSLIQLLIHPMGSGQPNNPDSLFRNFKSDIEFEQSLSPAGAAMDDDTRISYYLLISQSPVEDLVRYTNDPNPAIRAYMFAGLLRREIRKEMVLKILDQHQQDTARFLSGGADVITEWSVQAFMKASWQLKASGQLPAIDYQKELDKLRHPRGVVIPGLRHGCLDKKDFLSVDQLLTGDQELKILSFSLIAGEMELLSPDNHLTTEMKELIKRSEAGQVFYFTRIKAMTDGRAMTLASVTVQIK